MLLSRSTLRSEELVAFVELAQDWYGMLYPSVLEAKQVSINLILFINAR